MGAASIGRIRSAASGALFAFVGLMAFRASALEVEITGLPPDLERNVRAYLSIEALAQKREDGRRNGNGNGKGKRKNGNGANSGSGGSRGDGANAGDGGNGANGANGANGETNGEPSEAKNGNEGAQQDSGEAVVTERRLRRLNREAPDQIRAALQPFGYYDPEISSSLEQEDGEWVARYDVKPGQPTVLTAVDIEVHGPGRDEPAVQAALRSSMLSVGDVLNHQRYNAVKQQLSQAAYDAGYLDAAYERAEMRVQPEAREAEIHLILETGPRYYFGDIQIEQDILDPNFVARYVPIEAGSPFDTDRLLALQQSLNDSGYFNNVTVEVKRDDAVNQRIPIVVHTTPRPTQEYQLGFGYGTDTGARLSLGADLRRLNRQGHRLRADLRLSSIEQTAAVEYRIPIRDVATDYLAFRSTLGAVDVGDWNTQQLVLGASWHTQWRGAQHGVYVTAQRERYSTDASLATHSSDLFFAGMQLSRQAADDPIYPSKGYSWLADLRGGSGALGSDVSYSRFYLSANFVRPIGKRVRYLLRGEYGAIGVDDDDFASLPPSQRFYAGGESSVRGYAFQALSPGGDEGDSLGGRYLVTASAEIDVLIVGDYGAAFFVDAGNAANDPWPDLKRGAGVGLRWRSPVGMIGIDLAHPLDDPETDFRIHLHIGGEL